MNKQFSLICPSIRPQYWKEFCDSLKDNELNWEVLFIGPKSPIEELPSNARWIETSVKPAQCTHIGFMEAKGEYVSITADDAVYFTPDHRGALDNMYKFIKDFPENTNYNKYKIAYGFRMFEDAFCAETSYTHYIVAKDREMPPERRTSPLLFPFFVIANGLYQEMSGYDNRFITGQCENDLLFRIKSASGHTANALCPTAMVWAIHNKHSNSGSFRKYHQQDFSTLRNLWVSRNPEGKETFLRFRTDINVQKYDNNDTLYTISQGEKGEWI